VDTDTDKDGHFTCDYERGKKVCRKNYFNESTNCKQFCKDSDTDEEGHYTCDENGNKNCSQCWDGPAACKTKVENCTVTKPPPTEGTKPTKGGPGDSGQQKDNKVNTAAIVTPIVILAALAGAAGAAYYFVIRKKKKNKVGESTMDLQQNETPISINSPDT